jgi:two-component system sensor histidine kinase UhpB
MYVMAVPADALIQLIEALPLPVIGLDEQLKITMWNAAAARTFGWTAEEALGFPNPTLPPDLRAEWEAMARQILAGGEQFRNVRTTRLCRDGSRIEMLMSNAATRATADAAAESIAVFVNLSEIEQREARTRKAEERARALLEATVDLGVLIFDDHGTLRDANPHAERMFGASRHSAFVLADLYRPEERTSAGDDVAETLRSGSISREGWRVRGDGTAFWADVVMTAVEIDADREVVVVVRDAEARRYAARAREEIGALAHEALAARTIEALEEATVRRAGAATGAAHTELVHFPTPPAPGTLPGDAAITDSVVTRPLTEADYAAYPHLRELGLLSGAAAPVIHEGSQSVLTVYSRGGEVLPHSALPLTGCAALASAAAARLDAERSFVESEATVRLMADQVPALIWSTDADLRFTAIRGQVAGEVNLGETDIGRTLLDVGGPRSASIIQAMRRVVEGGETLHYDYEFEGHTFDVRVDPLRGIDGSIRGTVAVAFDVTDRVKARGEIRQLAARLSTAEEEQRRRIARELHDEMGQRLTALRFELENLRLDLGGVARERIEAMDTLIRETGDTMRRVISDLRPPMLDDFGFNAAVKGELVTWERRSGIRVDLSLPEHDPPLDRDRTTALYRIIQEALTNVARHAGATRVKVTVTVNDADVRVEISDDGRGITTEEATEGTSQGLTGVRERTLAFGGEVAIEGSRDAGTTIALRLPIGPPTA